MAMTQLEIAPLHPSLGAEITGVDLGQPIDVPTRQALSRALADHLALVFRDQKLTPAQYLAAASVFGPPMEQHYSQHNMPDFPLIGLIWHRNGQQPAEQWHTDHTNRERPPSATILYGVEIPSAGGGTSVANMRAAYAHGSIAVYFHISKATHIAGMTPQASKLYMRGLLDRTIEPAVVYHHRWRKGDVLIIDN